MDIFSKRPLFISCMLFLACSVSGFFMPPYAKLITAAICAIALVFSLILAIFKYYSSGKKQMFITMILCFIMAIISLVSSYLFLDMQREGLEKHYDKEVMIEGVVTSVNSENNFSSSYTLSVERLNLNEEKHKAMLECEYPAALEIGDRVTVKAIAEEPQCGGRYDERISAISEGIFVIYTSSGQSELVVTRESEKNSPELFFEKLNYDLSISLTQKVKGDAGALSAALLLGNKSFLSPEITRDFRRVGASHILALSGLHMSLIMGAFMLLLKQFIRKIAPRAVILSLISLFYLALTGFSVSATRSVIMLLVVYLSYLISGLPDSLTSLSFAGALIVLVSPGAVVDAGFWMSFAATLGILVYMSPVNDYFNECLSGIEGKFRHRLAKIFFSVISAILTSLAALLPLIIVMCIFIRELSLLSVLSSVVLSLPTALVITASLILLPFCQVPYLSTFLANIIRVSAGFMIDFCAEHSELEGIVISLNYPFAVLMAFLLGAALLFSFASKRFNPLLTLIPFALCIAIFAGAIYIYEDTNKDKLKVSYINVSSNSDMLVLTNEREAVICDLSNGSKTSYMLALDEIYDSRATEIKAVMITRYTHAHNATLYSLFRSNKVREVWLPYPENEDEYAKMEVLYSFARYCGVSVYTYNEGETMKPFEHTYIEHMSENIERSAVPIDLLGIYTGREHLTYISPAFNESELLGVAEYAFSKSQYVIFGNRGPKVKNPYTIRDMSKLKTITFSSDLLAAYFVEPEFSFTRYYMVTSKGEMEFYLEE